MSYSKLIHDYLDGELDPIQQDGLFSRIAVDSDVKTEFNQQMKLHVITRNDMGTISPPLQSTNAIFSALGFSIPSSQFSGTAGVASGASAGIGTALMLGAKKYFPYAITTILATAITALIFFYFFDKYFATKDDMASAKHSQIPVVASYDRQPSPVVSSPQNAVLTKREVERLFVKTLRETIENMFSSSVPPMIASIEQSKEQNPINQGNEYRNISKSGNRINSLDNSLFAGKSKDEQIKYSNYLPVTYALSPFSNFREQQDETRVGFELRNINSKSDQNVSSLPSGSKPWFSNMGAALIYQINNNHSIGVSIGQEQYGQNFTRLTDGVVYSFKQNPMLFWYGLTYKLTLPELLYANVIYPYATVVIGGTTVGPLGRIQAGLTYQPDKRVSFTLGAEASALYYNVQNNIYSSKKLGFTYGIGIHY